MTGIGTGSRADAPQDRAGRARDLCGDVARVMFGPWPIRPLLTGLLMAMIFQYSAADIDAAARLNVDAQLSTLPLSALRGAIVGLPLWALMTLRRGSTRGRPLTRLSYLAILGFGAVCAGSTRFWLSGGDLLSEPRLFVVFVIRAMFLLLIFHAILGLADVRLRAQVRRADLALAEVERQRAFVLQADERARDEVSRFLHNRVQAGLVTIGMQLRQLEGQITTETAERVASICDELETIRTEDVRQASRALSPDIRNIGLAAALRNLAGQYEPGMNITLVVEGWVSSEGESSGDCELGCYRIVEQALLNATVHGRARNVDVEVLSSRDVITMSVVDDDTGLHIEGWNAGTGMAIMDAWCSRYGGTWSVTSTADGSGTRVDATLVRSGGAQS